MGSYRSYRRVLLVATSSLTIIAAFLISTVAMRLQRSVTVTRNSSAPSANKVKPYYFKAMRLLSTFAPVRQKNLSRSRLTVCVGSFSSIPVPRRMKMHCAWHALPLAAARFSQSPTVFTAGLQRPQQLPGIPTNGMALPTNPSTSISSSVTIVPQQSKKLAMT